MKGNAFSVDLRWREKVSNETRTTAVYLTTARTNLGLLISLLMQCPAPADERPLVDRLIGYTDAGLAHLKGLTNLTDLTLYSTQLTDAGRRRLGAYREQCAFTAMNRWPRATRWPHKPSTTANNQRRRQAWPTKIPAWLFCG